MKAIDFLLAAFLSLSMAVNAQQADLPGKTFISPQGSTCKSMTDGGCWISWFRVMEFEADSVMISWRVEASCTPVEREEIYEHMRDNLRSRHKWTSEKGILKIEGSEEFGILTINGPNLSGFINSAGMKVETGFYEEKIAGSQ